MFKKRVMALCVGGLLMTSWATAGEAYIWPTYDEKLNYNISDMGVSYNKPTKDVEGSCFNKAKAANGVYHGDYWAFYHGANKNPLVTEASIIPMLQRLDEDFAYITDTLGWPRDGRVKDGYYSAVYLYGSDACTGSNNPDDKGGWQSWIDGYAAIAASYYPGLSFDTACTYNDEKAQKDAMVHEGINAILTDMGAAHVHWFQEGGNTWLQQEMEVRRSGATQYSGMGFLNVGNLIAPFVPIESYSGWLLDGSFGGPGAEGVDAGGKCNWRNTLGGVQYGNLFPTFLGLWVAEGAVAWIWKNIPNRNGKYILESMGAAIGDEQIRSLILEYRSKLALADMKKWSEEMRRLLNGSFGSNWGCEWTPCAVDGVPTWRATPYVVTTNNNGILTPEERTTPGWSGANVIPLTVSSGATQVKLSLQNAGAGMALQIAYRATDGTPVYSAPVFGNNQTVLNLSKTPQSNVVFAVVANTDYNYSEALRKTHFDYRLKLDAGISGAADPHTKWYSNFKLDYDWDNAKVVHKLNDDEPNSGGSTSSSSSGDNGSSNDETSSSSVAEIVATTVSYKITKPIYNDYTATDLPIDLEAIASDLGVSANAIQANMFNGINEDGSLYTGNTANGDVGHWFAANGDVVNWNENTAYVFVEWDLASAKVNIGTYPNKILAGEEYLVRQAITSGNKRVIVEFKITIESTTLIRNIQNLRQHLKLSHFSSGFEVNFSVATAGKVKLGLYTAYGALITNLINEYHSAGDYNRNIDLNAMGLPKGVYLVKLSYPGYTETKAYISAYR